MGTRLHELQPASHYEGLGRTITADLIIPALKASVEYDRLTSFFSVDSMVACAEGIDSLWERHDRMRLVLGLHAVPSDLATAALSTESIDVLVSLAKARVIEECKKLTDEIIRNRIGA